MLTTILAKPAHPAYWQHVRNVRRANLIAYWPLGETSGSIAADLSGNEQHGTYTGVTLAQPGIGDGRTAPFFDGANDFVNVLSPGLASAFNGAAGTIALWFHVNSPANWTDAAVRRCVNLMADSGNRIYILKEATGNRLDMRYVAGGVSQWLQKTAYSPTGWVHAALTWSQPADEVVFYLDGVPQGAPFTGLGVWTGALTSAVVGASTTVPGDVWHGWLAHVALWSAPLAAPEVARLARP